MSVLAVDIAPLVPRKRPYPPGVGSAPEAVLDAGGRASQQLAEALRNIEARLNLLDRVLREQSPVVRQIEVVDSTGKVIAALGDFIFAGVPATNYFSEIHAGDPLNTGDPSQALFNANTDGSVTIGQHGWLDVLDPYGADAAWIGTQNDVLPVTGAANNGSGLIRLTVTAHTLVTGDVVQVRLVEGVTSATDGTSNANGTWTVTVIDANHFDLQNSVFVGTYVSGGTVDRLKHVTGAVDNGGGVIRLTVTAHAYESGDKVNIAAVGGVPNATGQWIIDVITANTFDLVGSTFAGAYTSGGTALRYFAGGLFQTIAIGPSFVDYRFRAFADGSLRIRGATFSLDLNGVTTSIQNIPIPPYGNAGIKVLDNVNLWYTALVPGGMVVIEPGGTAVVQALLQAGAGNAGLLEVKNPASSVEIRLDGATAIITGFIGSGSPHYNLGPNAGLQLFNPGLTVFLDPAGIINITGHYEVGGVAGLTVTRSFGTSLTVNTVANGVTGTPGAGQANATVVTGVTLNLTSNTFRGGILT